MTTFATLDIANLTVAFHATEADADAAGDARDHFVVCSADGLTILSGPQQVALYNATAAELATNITPVNKFSGKEAGAKRLWANLVDLCDVRLGAAEAAAAARAAELRSNAALDALKAAAQPVQLVTVCYTSVDGVTDTRKFKTLIGAQRYAVDRVGQHPEMGHNYAASGDGVGKVSVKGATLKELFTPATATAAAAPRAPAQPGKEVWRRVKHEAAQKVAYRPLEGSVQAGLYDLLTAEGGMTMEEYCDKARQLKTRDATLFTPPQVWGALRYLFVTKRGYGLDFDGSRIRLVLPADERRTGKE